MKKLIIAAAIVCAAAISHGAALNWSMASITKGTSSVAAGAVAYFMDATTYTAFSAAAANEKAAYCVANSKYSSTVVAGRGGVLSVSQKSGTYAAGDSISGYIVLFDNADATKAGFYANTATASTTVPATGADPTLAWDFATGTTGWTKTSDPEPTPEPTSALLMLLGVAGLALKRKQK